MLVGFLRTLVFLVFLLVLLLVPSPASAVCGDADGDADVDIADILYIMAWFGGTGPAPSDFNQADSDDRQGLTIHDVAYLARYLSLAGAAPVCPPTMTRYVPTNDPNLDITHATSFPANVTSTNIEIFLTNTTPVAPLGISFPVLVRVNGATPSALTFTIDGVWPGPLEQTTNIAGGPNGSLLLTGNDSAAFFISAGARKLGTLSITMPTSDPSPRTISLSWTKLPPNQNALAANEPMFVDDNLVGTIPALNGLYPGAPIGILGAPRTVYVGKPVFFSGLATVSVNSWDWDFGDGSLHGTVQNPVHSYATPGLKTVTLDAVLTAGGNAALVRTDYINVLNIKADFTANQRLGVAPLTVNFFDNSLGAPNTWLWNFGDLPTSGLQNPSHVYNTPGLYTVDLTASLGPASDMKTWVNCVKVDAVATPDLEVRSPATRARPGFIHDLILNVRNLGSGPASGVLTLDLSAYPALPAGTGFVSSVPPPDVSAAPIYQWNLPVINWDPTQTVFDDYEVVVKIQVAVGTLAGTWLNSDISVTTAPAEVVTTNNALNHLGEVKASWDPNDKLVQPVCAGANYARGSERLQYTILFENKPEATAEATYVLIVDTLDPGLDLGTFTLGPSSHESVLEFDLNPTTREAIWFFDNIMLQPNISPPEGEGFVSFTISPTAGQLDGTVIPNRAHIRFDFEAWLAAPDAGPSTVTIASVDVNTDGIPDICAELCCDLPGDADNSGDVNIGDVLFIVAFIFSGGPVPVCYDEADADGGGDVNIGDALVIIDFIFGGPLPDPICGP